MDVLELATKYKRFTGINKALAVLFWLKNSHLRLEVIAESATESAAANMMRDCDMARIAQAPLWASMALKAVLPRGRMIARRQQNFASYARNFDGVRAGCQTPFSGEYSVMYANRILWKNLPASSLQQDGKLLLAWDRLNAANGNLPFLAGDVIVSALKILGDGNERLLIAYEGTNVLAMFLLSPKRKFRWQTFQPSQLPLGAWVAEAHVQLPDIARSLLRGPIGLCLVLSITQVDPRITPRTEDTPDSQNSDYIDTGWIDIQGSFDEYWSARGKNLRQNMRKQRAKLLADGVKLTMQELRDHADMAPAVARYGSIESAGWKAQKGTAIHLDNAQGRYYRELLEHATSLRGEAVVYQYLFDDRVVAMNLCLARKGTLIVLKTTYDESIQSYSPAFLLHETELQEIYKEDQIKHLEYYGRLMEWHTKWTEQKRTTLYHLTLYRWPFLKKLAEARRRKANATEVTANPPTSAIADPS